MTPYLPGQPVTVQHLKPWKGGKPIQMRGTVAHFDGEKLLLERLFRSPGQPYDGLYANQQPGDHGTIELWRGGWVSRRRYLRANSELIGELYNIQTPTKFLPGLVRYVDLEIDVAYLPHYKDRAQIQDEAELEAAVAQHHIPEQVAAAARQLARELARRLREWDGQGPLDWNLHPAEMPPPSLLQGLLPTESRRNAA